MPRRFTLSLCLLVVFGLGYGTALLWSGRDGRGLSAPGLPRVPRSGGDASSGLASGPGTPAEFAERIRGVGRRWQLDEAWEAAIAAVPVAQLPATLAEIDRLPHRVSRRALRSAVYARWAREDPAAALEHAQARSSVRQREAGIAAVIDGWSFRSLTAAAEWVRQTPAGLLPDAALVNLVNRLSTQDPAAAATLASRIQDARERRGALWRAYRDWAEDDPLAAVAAAEQALPAHERTSVLQGIVAGWARDRPEEAVAWIRSRSRPDERTSLLNSLLRQWSE